MHRQSALLILPLAVFVTLACVVPASGSTLTFKSFISVGNSPEKSVLTPNGAELYVTNYGSNNVSVINTATHLVTATVPVGTNPLFIVVSSDGSKVYVGNNGGGVSIIDTATKAVTNVATPGPVRDLALSPDGSRLYLAMEFSGLKQMSTATNVISNVSGTVCPEGLAISGSLLYVNYQCTGGGHDIISRFDANTGAFIGSTTGLANVGHNITASPDFSQVWANGGDACSSPSYNHVGCPASPGVPESVINVLRGSDGALLTTIGLTDASLMSFTPDSKFAIVGGASLKFFDTTTFILTDTIALAGSGDVVFNTLTGFAYAAIPGTDEVAVFTTVATPEPTSLLLLTSCLLAFGAYAGKSKLRK